jgi:hypothetical protein
MKLNFFKKKYSRYLFKAEFTDLTSFKQPEDDHSELDPEKRNAWFDLQQSDKKIKNFSLSNGIDTWSVNLLTGMFFHNGMPFLATPEQDLLKLKPELRLVYFREVQRDVTFTFQDGEMIDQNEIDARYVYFLGWQCTIKRTMPNGEIEEKNYQQLIGIK